MTKKLTDYMTQGMEQTVALTGLYIRQRGDIIYACPIGAACWAKDSRLALSGVSREYGVLFPELAEIFLAHPVSQFPGQMSEIIVNLVDTFGWTREQVRDWLRREGY